MGDHSLPTTRPEPVLLLDAVKALLALGVGLGWVRLDDLQVQLVLTAVGAVLTVVLSIVTRKKVTPVVDPVAADGSLLMPVTELLADDYDATDDTGWPPR